MAPLPAGPAARSCLDLAAARGCPGRGPGGPGGGAAPGRGGPGVQSRPRALGAARRGQGRGRGAAAAGSREGLGGGEVSAPPTPPPRLRARGPAAGVRAARSGSPTPQGTGGPREGSRGRERLAVARGRCAWAPGPRTRQAGRAGPRAGRGRRECWGARSRRGRECRGSRESVRLFTGRVFPARALRARHRRTWLRAGPRPGVSPRTAAARVPQRPHPPQAPAGRAQGPQCQVDLGGPRPALGASVTPVSSSPGSDRPVGRLSLCPLTLRPSWLVPAAHSRVDVARCGRDLGTHGSLQPLALTAGSPKAAC